MNEAQVETVDARRIGLLSDTHFTGPDGSDVPQVLLDAFRAVDLIMHLGHISSPGALDRLETVAPVFAVQTELDDQLFGDRLADEIARGRTRGYTRVIGAGGLRIGAVHDFSIRGIEVALVEGEGLRFPAAPMVEILTSKFGATVNIVAFAATHIEMVLHRQGVLLVNPGSPNLPAGRAKGSLGTVAILDVRDGVAQVEIIDLARPRS